MKYKINRNLIAQLYVYALFGSGVIISILLVLQMLRLSEFLIVYNISLMDLTKLISFLSVSFLPVVIPTAMIFSTFSVLGRFVQRREWLGVLTCGIGYKRILFPVLLYFALPMGILCLFISLTVVPWGSRQVELTFESIYKNKSLTSVRKKVFLNLFDGMVMFVGGLDTKTNTMEKIFLYDERSSNTPISITARSGMMNRNLSRGKISLHLSDGIVQTHAQQEQSLRSLKYDGLDIEADIGVHGKTIFPAPASLDIWTLRRDIQKFKAEGRHHGYLEFLIDFHRRFALPVAAFVFVLLGFSISLSSQKRYFRLSPMVQSLVVLLIYWVCYVTNNLLTFQGYLPAWVGLWFSVILFFAVSLHQLYTKRIMY